MREAFLCGFYGAIRLSLDLVSAPLFVMRDFIVSGRSKSQDGHSVFQGWHVEHRRLPPECALTCPSTSTCASILGSTIVCHPLGLTRGHHRLWNASCGHLDQVLIPDGLAVCAARNGALRV